jgi:hypothetical protein
MVTWSSGGISQVILVLTKDMIDPALIIWDHVGPMEVHELAKATKMATVNRIIYLFCMGDFSPGGFVLRF